MISTDPSFRFHWKCAELWLFQLGFADDLLLFYAADDHSIGLFQRGLDLFVSLSGLYVNPAKSQLILSKAAHTERTQLLQLLDFQEGILPVRYLGPPLISSRLSLAACRPLLQKIDDRTTGSGYSKVAWARVCTPIEEGGLGIRNLSALNMAMIARKLWEVVCNESRFSLWHDPWHQLGPLISRYPLGPNATGTHSVDRLQRMIVDGSWRWPAIPGMGYGEITHDLPPIHGDQDSIQWNGGSVRLTNGVAYELFQPRGPKVEWFSLLLGPLKIHRNTFILWLAILDRLSTLDKPWLYHINGTYSLCSGGHVETHQHLFFDCQYSRLCLASIRHRVRFPWPFRD
ncbi:UNVERIFIED_CONTAM: hypothetical protein Slati_4134200 [Sesamum latifolium]|uniref:Reverse transcriptase zinc-binding domain-containing protein n=1 Tax=Sesamum latifolium TaxID=2727402 RepID=A0AAW2TA92_9LAMI